jgi:succinate dehydrogenase / fumarate reductase cytochrome b subunit
MLRAITSSLGLRATWESLAPSSLIFLVIHLKGFWYEMHWGGIATANYDGTEYKNLYAVVDAAYTRSGGMCSSMW